MQRTTLTRKVRAKQVTIAKLEEELGLTPPEPVMDPALTGDWEEPAKEIVFRPHPGPQTDFLASTEREVLYGGAAGGGKSYAILVDPLRYAYHPAHRAILFRRTNDELRELVQKSKELYPSAYPGAKYQEQKSQWTFPSGATMWFTYLDRDDDVLRYQGQAFNWVGFDELTQWPSPFPWDYMRSRLRTTTADLPLMMRATANPGNVGGWWVRKMFIDPDVANVAFDATNLETGEVMTWPKGHTKCGEPLFQRRFIPARLQDNPSLALTGEYEANLLALPDALRKQLLHGDWDVSQNAAFPEFDKSIHVITPFEIATNWTKFRGCDWGFSSPACVLWFAIDWDNNVFIYREYYGKGKDAEQFTEHILHLDGQDRIAYGVMDGSVWSRRGETSPSVAEIMARKGLVWRPSDRSPGSRRSNKFEVHRRLRVSPETEKPSVFIFSTCTNLIRTMAAIPTDKNDPEDAATDGDDHAYDAFRYGLASRPMARNDFAFGENHRIVVNPTPVDKIFGY